MSVLGSQVDVDMDESVPDPVPKHQGHTGTGCYKLHDHEFLKHRHRPPRKGGTGVDDEVSGPGRPNPVPLVGAGSSSFVPHNPNNHMNNTNLIDLPVDCGSQPNPVQLNNQYALKTKSPPAQRTPVSTISSWIYFSPCLPLTFKLLEILLSRPAWFFLYHDIWWLCAIQKPIILLFLSKMSIELKTYKWDDVDFTRWSGVFS